MALPDNADEQNVSARDDLEVKSTLISGNGERYRHDRKRSPGSLSRVIARNRRKRYLELNPEYFKLPSLELAGVLFFMRHLHRNFRLIVQDPLAYDRLVRRFQSNSEREIEGKRKGYSGVLEADLWRSEAKVEALSHPDHAASMRYVRDENGEILAEERDEVPPSKEEGWDRWRSEMEARFVRGEDLDFNYSQVDGNEQFDDRKTQEREHEDSWFDLEEPAWVTPDGRQVREGSREDSPQHILTGQTGIQDF